MIPVVNRPGFMLKYLRVRSMNKALAYLFIIAAIPAAGGSARADTHAVVESTRLYMDQETKVTLEYWIGRDRSSRKAAGRVTVTRGDLGLTWTLDLNEKTYAESALRNPAGPPSRRTPDMKKLWLDVYDPAYDWTITPTGEKKTVAGFNCREFQAVGQADFAEMSATYWVCLELGVPGAAAFHDYLLAQYEGDNRMAALLKILQDNPGGFCVYREEMVEPSIAPTTRAKVGLSKLEEAEPPPGTYEIPEGFRKVGGRGDSR